MTEDIAAGRLRGALERLALLWALGGGALVLAVVAVNVASVVGGALLARPFPGDVELTQLGVAVGVFAFLPYAQLTGAHISADIFTSRLSARNRTRLALLGELAALLFAALLLWRMSLGMWDQRAYGYTTAVLGIPIWWAFVPILLSLALWALASLAALRARLDELRRA